MRRAPYVVIVVSFAAALTAVACAARTHKALVTFDATALSAVRVIGQVEVSLSSAGLLTPQQSLTIRQKLAPVIALGQSATTALIAWQPGQSVPPDLFKLSDALGSLLTEVVKTLPEGEAKSKLLTVIAVAQAAWAAVLVVIVKGTP